MSMLQVRWSLTGSTPTKRKTLAADYNPIHKRLRDFGTEAQELETQATNGAPEKAPSVVNKLAPSMPQPLSSAAPRPPVKQSSMSDLAAKADALGPMRPVTLQSIVAELEGAGLLGSALEAPKSPPQSEAADVANAPAKTRQLSLGAAGLLNAAGLMPAKQRMPGATRTKSNSSDAGVEGPASDAGSNDEGSAFDSTQAGDEPCERIDPFAFFDGCETQAETSAPPAVSAPPPPEASHVESVESAASLSSQEIRKHNEDFLRLHARSGILWQGVIPGSRQQGVIDPAALEQMRKPASVQGSHSASPVDSQQLVMPLPASIAPSLAPMRPPTALPPLSSLMPGSVRSDDLLSTIPTSDLSTEQVFEELAEGLEEDQSENLLSELNGLCDFDDDEDGGAAQDMDDDDGAVCAESFFLSLSSEEEDESKKGAREEEAATVTWCSEFDGMDEVASEQVAETAPAEQAEMSVPTMGGVAPVVAPHQGILGQGILGQGLLSHQGILPTNSDLPANAENAMLLSELEALPVFSFDDADEDESRAKAGLAAASKLEQCAGAMASCPAEKAKPASAEPPPALGATFAPAPLQPAASAHAAALAAATAPAPPAPAPAPAPALLPPPVPAAAPAPWIQAPGAALPPALPPAPSSRSALPYQSANPNATLPSVKSQAKFLPGAVATPAPAPPKHTVGRQSNTASKFSWQPIKFPVYK